MQKALSSAEKLHQYALRVKSAWSRVYNVFDGTIRAGKFETGAEVGVAFGWHIEALLRIPTVKKMYGIDPYLYTPTVYALGFSQTELDALYVDVLERLARFGDRYEHIRQRSADAAGTIPEQLDFVYIDADHSYEGISMDLRTWFPKVREGGVIGGHDYAQAGFPGIKRAVDRFFGRLGYHVYTGGQHVWWIEKRPLKMAERSC